MRTQHYATLPCCTAWEVDTTTVGMRGSVAHAENNTQGESAQVHGEASADEDIIIDVVRQVDLVWRRGQVLRRQVHIGWLVPLALQPQHVLMMYRA